MRPGLPGVSAPGDAGTRRVEQGSCRFIVECRSAERGDDVAFDPQPVSAKIGDRSVQTRQVGIESAGAEEDLLDADADLPIAAVAADVGPARTRRRNGAIRSERKCRRWVQSGGRKRSCGVLRLCGGRANKNEQPHERAGNCLHLSSRSCASRGHSRRLGRAKLLEYSAASSPENRCAKRSLRLPRRSRFTMLTSIALPRKILARPSASVPAEFYKDMLASNTCALAGSPARWRPQ